MVRQLRPRSGPSIEVEPDHVLAHRASEGDSQAFEELYRRHAPAAWRVAYAVAGNPDDAADAVSDAFTRVFQALPAGRLALNEQFRPYLLAATRNAALDGLRRLGRLQPTDAVEDLQRPSADAASEWAVDAVDSVLPGGRRLAWLVLAALILGMAALAVSRLLRRRTAELATRASERARESAPETPDELERRARAAEARGNLEAALRLRFRAGLLRLDARGAIRYRPSLPSGEVARALRSPDFDRVAAAFDEVVYGRRPPTPDDVRDSTARWESLVGSGR